MVVLGLFALLFMGYHSSKLQKLMDAPKRGAFYSIRVFWHATNILCSLALVVIGFGIKLIA
jgi:hypothetical protein